MPIPPPPHSPIYSQRYPQTEPPPGDTHHAGPLVPDAGPETLAPETETLESDTMETAPPIEPSGLGRGLVGLRIAQLVHEARHILARVERHMPQPSQHDVHELNVLVDCLSERAIRSAEHFDLDLSGLLAYRRDRERWLAVRAATRLTVTARRFAAMPLHKRLRVLERQKLETEVAIAEEQVRVRFGLNSID